MTNREYVESRFDGLHSEIAAVRRLKKHDLRHIELRFQDNKDALNIALVHAQRELDIFRIALAKLTAQTESDEKLSAIERGQLDKRLDSMNEFRLQLKDQAATFVTQAEFDVANKPNYTLYGLLITMFLATITAGWMVIGLQIDNANIPIKLQLAHIEETLKRGR